MRPYPHIVNIPKLKRHLNKGLITEHQVNIITYRFGINGGRVHTIEETAIKFGLTKGTISQRINTGFDKMGGLLKFIKKAYK